MLGLIPTQLPPGFTAHCPLPPAHGLLAVGLITPAFAVAGVMLASIPIVIHLLNRRRFKTVQWAAMDYLLKALRKNRRRLQFESWLLLAVRCLVLALLGLALARPFGCAESSVASMVGSRAGLHVIVIDNSYSMAYEADRADAKTHLDQAKKLATQLVDRLSAGGESVSIVTAGKPARAILQKPTYDLTAAKAAIARVEQTAGGTDLAGALNLALQIGREESAQQARRLYLLTDGTRGAWDTQQADAIRSVAQQLAGVYRVSNFDLGLPNQSNSAVVGLKPSSNLVTNRFGSDLVASVEGFGVTGTSPMQWRLDDQPLPGTAPIRPVPEPLSVVQSNAVFRTGGPHVVSASVSSGDRLRVDDLRSRVVDVQSDLKVLIVEGERGTGLLSGSGAFLSLALAPPKEAGDVNSAVKSDSYVSPEVVSDLELGNKILADYRALILCGVGEIPASQADQIQAFVKAGGTLLIFMGEPVSERNYNGVLLPRRLLPGTLTKRISVSSDQKGFTFDFNPKAPGHPYLDVFRGEEKSGLDTAQVFSYWQVDLGRDSKVERVLSYVGGEGSGVRVQGSGNVGTTEVPTTSKPEPRNLNPEPSSSLSLRAEGRTLNPSSDPAITVHSLGDGRVVFVSTTANADWTSLPAKPAYVTLMHELLAGSVNTGDRWLNLTVGEPLVVPRALRLTSAPTLRDPARNEVALSVAPGADGQSVYRSGALTLPGVYTLSTGPRTYPVAVNVPDDEADVRTLDPAAMRAALGNIDAEWLTDQLPPLASSNAGAGFDYGWPVMLAVLGLAGAECLMAMRFSHYRKK